MNDTKEAIDSDFLLFAKDIKLFNELNAIENQYTVTPSGQNLHLVHINGMHPNAWSSLFVAVSPSSGPSTPLIALLRALVFS